MKISLLVPTRKRPNQMKRLWDSALNTANNKLNLEIVFYIDDDDLESIKMINTMKSDQVKFVTGKRLVLSEAWNEAWKISSGDIYMHCGDDIIFRTNDWDKIVISEFEKVPDKILFVYGRDGIWDSEKLGTHGFLHKNWTDTIGYFVPPYFNYGRNDTWLTEVSTKLGRKRFIKEIYTEHMHFKRGKSKIDSTYRDGPARGAKDNVVKIWKDTQSKRNEDVKKLEKFIANFKEE